MVPSFVKNSEFQNVLWCQVKHRKVVLCAQPFPRGFNSLRLGQVEKTLVKTRSPEVFCNMTIVTTFNAIIVI